LCLQDICRTHLTSCWLHRRLWHLRHFEGTKTVQSDGQDFAPNPFSVLDFGVKMDSFANA